MSPLVIGEIFGVFFNTLTADGNDPVQYCENLPLSFQTQLPGKPKSLYQFLVPFLKSTLNFKQFYNRNDRHT